MRRFTGLANYYRRFVEGYAEIAAPLTAMGSPTARSVWSPEAQASFDTLKQALSSAPVLSTFDPSRRAVLTTDASSVAVAAILTQQDDEGRQHPVAYESRKLTAAELPGARAGAVGGSSRATGLQTLPPGKWRATTRGLLVGLRPADGQPGDHVAEDEHASEQDVCPLAR